MSNETTHLMMSKPIHYSADVTVFIMAAVGENIKQALVMDRA